MMCEAVLLHGWGMRASVWDTLRAQLADRNTRALDLPGHGGTAPLVTYTLDAVVDRLASEVSAEVDLVGWSLGGLLALHWAATRPTQVRRLTLIGATPCFVANADWPYGVSAAVLRIFMTQLKNSSDTLVRRFCALQAQGEANPDALAKVLYAQRANAAAQTLVDSLLLLGQSNVRSTLASIMQPTLILHGEQDAVTPTGAARWMATQLPRARLQTFSDCGHALPISRAKQCAEWIESFWNE